MCASGGFALYQMTQLRNNQKTSSCYREMKTWKSENLWARPQRTTTRHGSLANCLHSSVWVCARGRLVGVCVLCATGLARWMRVCRWAALLTRSSAQGVCTHERLVLLRLSWLAGCWKTKCSQTGEVTFGFATRAAAIVSISKKTEHDMMWHDVTWCDMMWHEHSGCGGCLQSPAVDLSIAVLQYCDYRDSPTNTNFC